MKVEAKEVGAVTGIYQESENFHINLGDKTIHAKRMPGIFRSVKNYTQSIWLLFFLFPYVRWNGRQAVLFDITNSQFHIFNVTILPQDIWILALILLLLAMVLFAVTSVASRVFCGYFCFQTSWTDWFTWIENQIEGRAPVRRKLDAAAWSANKIVRKVSKHTVWMLLALLTGISFSIWFVDAFDYWNLLLNFQLGRVGIEVLLWFFAGTYILAGLMREQTCFWLCPYARIQAVMTDTQTILPTYDFHRGEPRAKIRRGANLAESDSPGDCIDCFQCVQVCPTGVDIRDGQQLGCITCGLCIDACNQVMDKIGRPRGLIRYASLDGLENKPVSKIYQRPRTMIYAAIIVMFTAAIVYGLTHLGAITLNVRPERQPLFVTLSDGSIQNKYEFRVLNKTNKDIYVKVTAEGGLKNQRIIGAEKPLLTHPAHSTTFSVFVKVSAENVLQNVTPIQFRVENIDNPGIAAEYATQFTGPNR
ncbi:MAG: cytochrome c oxidase accessory protein CcoG [Gallionella sp.]|nr:cytochrome c oxidase accessory protein CcoG [Gallionella sp.]